jgi:hypothetical protein
VVTQSGLTAVRYFVKMLVVPDPSDRWTMLTSVSGSCSPEFAAAMAGTFH